MPSKNCGQSSRREAMNSHELPADLVELERQLAERHQQEPTAEFRLQVLAAMRQELQRHPAAERSGWRFAVASLLLAWITACAARWRPRRGQRVLPVLAAVLLLAGSAALTCGTWFLTSQGAVAVDWFVYFLTWTLCFVVGAAFVLLRGWK